MKKGKDKKILEGILNHDSDVINQVYNKCFPKVEKMVLNYGGDQGSAKDIFQDAMLIVYRKICNNDLVLECKLTTYLFAICKNLWIQEYNSGKYTFHLSSTQADVVNEPDNNEMNELKLLEIYDRHFAKLSKDCQKILKMYFAGKNSNEIKKAFKYKSIHHTNDRKFRCKASLIRRIMNDPEFKEISNEIKKESNPLRRRKTG